MTSKAELETYIINLQKVVAQHEEKLSLLSQGLCEIIPMMDRRSYEERRVLLKPHGSRYRRTGVGRRHDDEGGTAYEEKRKELVTAECRGCGAVYVMGNTNWLQAMCDNCNMVFSNPNHKHHDEDRRGK
jgi:hypothetical protein